ncbi:MAG TPA: SelB C-terminal domain-containing protein, partial [Gemmatimonadales bacterium]|nr:SelB C-terminal domain-containing protein [Gemmatimonadales bacterium]
RTAIGLAGVDREAVRRGDLAVSASAPWQAATALDARLDLLPAAGRITDRTRLRVHLGTAEVFARVYPRGESDGRSLVRLALEGPLVARGGDRFVLRSFSPVTTIGGGTVVDPLPPRRGATWESNLASPDPSKRLEALAGRRRWGLDPLELPLLLGVSPSEIDEILRSTPRVVRVADALISADLKQNLKARIVAAVTVWHAEKPLEAGMPVTSLRQSLGRPAGHLAPALIAELVKAGTLRQQDSVVSIPGFKAKQSETPAEVDWVVGRLTEGGLTPPTAGELERETGRPNLLRLLRRAAQEGRLVAVAGEWFLSPEAVQRFVAELRAIGEQGPITPPVLRDRLGLTRKYLIPLLEWADAAGHTRREGDHRVLVRRR